MKSYDKRVQKHIVSEWEDNVIFDADDPDFSRASSGASYPQPNVILQRTTAACLSYQAATHHHHHHHHRLFRVPSGVKLGTPNSSASVNMSVASVQAPHLAELCNSLRTSLSMSSSLSDLVGGSPSLFDVSSDTVLTIEELREQMGSCYTCGVSWAEDQVSLDCSECGGYSLERPCMICDGICGQSWKRDFTMSHACGKSRWQGVCTKFPAPLMQLQSSAPLSSCASFGSHHQLMQSAAVANATSCHSSAAATASHQQQFLQQELCARLEKLSAKAHT